MKNVKMFVIAVIFWLFQEETAQAIVEIPLFQSFKVKKIIRLPYNRASMRLVSKLMGTAGYENVIFVLEFSHGTALKFEHNKHVVLMATVNPNQSINAVLLAPQDKQGRVDLGNSIQTKGAITTWITIPPTQLSALTPLIQAVQDAGTEAEMNSAWFALNKALRKIMLLVQDCMDENILQSAVICALYGFHVGGKGGKHVQIFEGFTGSVTGTVDMLADVGPKDCAYVWWSWNAARTVATYLMTSTYAHCTILGQASNVPLNVSCNWVEGETVTHESQIITVLPK